MLAVSGDELIEAMADAVFVVDPNGGIRSANAAAQRATGYSRTELAGRGLSDIVAAINSSDNSMLYRSPASEQTAGIPAWLNAKSGSRIPVSVTATPIGHENDAAIVVIAHAATASDSAHARALTEAETQLEQLRDQQIRTERLATLGRLAGGVGHELRNIAQLQVLALESLAHDLSTHDHQPHPALADLERTTQQVAAHAQRLLKLAHPAPDHTRQINLAEVVREVFATLTGAGKLRGIRSELALGDEPLIIAVSKMRFEQLVWSLVLNAVEAIGKAGGTLRVAATTAAPGRVVVEIADSGPGIAPESQSRIFEPFFTTKPGAPGLGLAVAKEIVEGHGGELAVTSTGPTGTTLRFDVPRAT